MINSLSLWPAFLDVWGYYDAEILPILAPLDHNRCYAPRLYNAPTVSEGSILPGQFLQYMLKVTPGSLIWGIFCGNLFSATPYFTLQITDLSTKHRFWQTPVSNYFIGNGQNLNFPNLLNTPYPVVGNGRLQCDFHADILSTGSGGGPVRVYAIIGVAEAVECR